MDYKNYYHNQLQTGVDWIIKLIMRNNCKGLDSQYFVAFIIKKGMDLEQDLWGLGLKVYCGRR